MSALKDIRVAFFFSDEKVFEKVKQDKTESRLVQWADAFYKRYGFKLNTYPLAYNESLYKKTFCLDKTNGLKGIHLMKEINEIIFLTITNKKDEAQLEYTSFAAPTTDEIKAYTKKLEGIRSLMTMYAECLSTIKANEYSFRKKLDATVKANKDLSRLQKPVVYVVFCSFIHQLKEIHASLDAALNFTKDIPEIDDGTLGLTLRYEIDKLFMYTDDYKKEQFDYLQPIILLNVDALTKDFEYVLAHEIVHAAGHTTKDNEGTKGNIMIYKDAEKKKPTDVKLMTNDKKRIEASFFVI